MWYVGLDFGTTKTAMSVYDEQDKPIPFASPTFPQIAPTAIAWDDNASILIGKPARDYLLKTPYRGTIQFKSRLAEPAWYLSLDQHNHSAMELASHFLTPWNLALQETWKAQYGQTPHSFTTVLTVPAYADETTRQATLKAATQAGWTIDSLQNEPTAIAFAHFGQHPPPHESQHMVFDLGGGTLDITLFRVEQNELVVTGVTGESELGGKDWDDCLALDLGFRLSHQIGWNPLDDPQMFAALRAGCESCKHQLSTRQEATFSSHYQGERWSVTWHRDEFEALTKGLVQRCISLARTALESASVSHTDIHSVLLAGGSSNMPMIQRALETEFPGKTTLLQQTTTAVADGAAYIARQQDKKRKPQTQSPPAPHRISSIQECTSHPLGMLLLQKGNITNRLLFKANTPLPAIWEEKAFATSTDNQTNIECYFTQNLDAFPAPESICFGFEIQDIPPKPAGHVSFQLRITQESGGLIELTAKDNQTGKHFTVKRIENPGTCQERLAPPPRDIALAIDCSASMSGRSILEAKLAAVEFLNQIPLHNQRFCLISFGDPETRLRVPLQTDTLAIKAHLAELRASGTTPLGPAIALALQSLQKPRLDGTTAERIILILTDGHPDQPTQAAALAKQAHKQGIRIITVGIGNKVQEPYLQNEICSSPEDYKRCGDSLQLPTLLASLATELTGGSGALLKWPTKKTR